MHFSVGLCKVYYRVELNKIYLFIDLAQTFKHLHRPLYPIYVCIANRQIQTNNPILIRIQQGSLASATPSVFQVMLSQAFSFTIVFTSCFCLLIMNKRGQIKIQRALWTLQGFKCTSISLHHIKSKIRGCPCSWEGHKGLCVCLQVYAKYIIVQSLTRSIYAQTLHRPLSICIDLYTPKTSPRRVLLTNFGTLSVKVGGRRNLAKGIKGLCFI